MDVTLVAAGVEDKPVVANLMQLYLYDFSEFAGWAINGHGLFNYPRLDHYWTEPDHRPFLIRVDGELAGFALVKPEGEGDTQVQHLAEFFILRKFRRRGIGESASRHLFDLNPGTWSIAQIDSNTAARRFWHRVIERYTGGAFTEQRDEERGRTVQQFRSPPGRP